jgi:4-amino-4-deoxy-L-arabinose transferase-like glycosyltransferase
MIAIALVVGAGAILAAWLDLRYGWIAPAFYAFAHQFYEVPLLARLRGPSQLVLTRWHLAILSAYLTLGLAISPWLSRHARAWMAIFGVAYVLRAAIWICGSNLPLVPGDSCHYVEVATSVLRGEGPVKHYVESFFADYPAIREGRGVLDDWATPLDGYVRALSMRIAGVSADDPPEVRFVVAKACSFVLNLLALPALYGFTRRRYGPRVALWAMAALAVLPVHAIYAGFVLRESLVVLTSVLAVWTLTEVWQEETKGAAAWALSTLGGLCAGLAILARTTALALVAAAGLYFAFRRARRQPIAVLLWMGTIALTILPWSLATYREYGRPFHSYTSYFEYNFSWTVHHYEKGNTRASQFYTAANGPEIVRVKVKSLLIIVVYSTMIVGLPIVAGFFGRLKTRGRPGRETDLLVASIALVFVLATLKSVADVTQVAQLGRYYAPLYVLMLPTAVAGLIEWYGLRRIRRRVVPWLAAGYVAMIWADLTWAYDASWFTRRFQLHWPAIREAGEWIQHNPQLVPTTARIMTWFPWELRVASDRTTVLMPRNYHPRRIEEVIRQYGVTHFLWGSFEPPPYDEINPESRATRLDRLRVELGLSAEREVFRSKGDLFFPVRLYRLR